MENCWKAFIVLQFLAMVKMHTLNFKLSQPKHLQSAPELTGGPGGPGLPCSPSLPWNKKTFLLFTCVAQTLLPLQTQCVIALRVRANAIRQC